MWSSGLVTIIPTPQRIGDCASNPNVQPIQREPLTCEIHWIQRAWMAKSILGPYTTGKRSADVS